MARARHDPADLTAKARATFLGRFVEDARALHPHAADDEIVRVAGELKRVYFLRLAAASSRARSQKAAPPTNGTAQELDRDFTTTAHRRTD